MVEYAAAWRVDHDRVVHDGSSGWSWTSLTCAEGSFRSGTRMAPADRLDGQLVDARELTEPESLGYL